MKIIKWLYMIPIIIWEESTRKFEREDYAEMYAEDEE